MKVVCNTTPIITLASIGRTDLFKEIFGTIIVAKAVYNEIKAKPGYGYGEVDQDFVQVQTITGHIYRDLLLNQLDPGEAETILLAKEIEADLVIIDERLGYRVARNAGLNVTRTLSILLRAKEKGLIAEIRPLLEEMIDKGIWYLQQVYRDVLFRAGEIPKY